MENISVKLKRNFSKVFILSLIFMGMMSILSVVNAAEDLKGNGKIDETKTTKVGDAIVEYANDVKNYVDEYKKTYENGKDILDTTKGTITMMVGQEVLIRPTKTTGGKIIDIRIDGTSVINDGKSSEMVTKYGMTVSQEKDADRWFDSKAKLHVRITAKVVGTHKISIDYYPSQATAATTAEYTVNIEEKEMASIVIYDQYKYTYTPGDEISLVGISVSVNYYDGTTGEERINAKDNSEVSISPTKAPNKAGKHDVTLTYKDVSATYQIHVNPIKNDDDETPEKPTTPVKPTTPTTPATTAIPQYSDGTAVKKGDSVKMTKGNSWNVYSDSSCKTIKTYIQANKGLIFKVEDINGNFVKLSQNGKEVGYIKWYNSSTGAMSYFSKVESSPVEEEVEIPKIDVNYSEDLEETLNLVTELLTKILTSLLESLSTACK